MMDKLIGPEMEPFVFTYLEDIIIVMDTFEEQLEWLCKVIKVIDNANLRINLEKSEFDTSEVQYLGFLVNEKGHPAPRSRKEMRRFLGMTSWYRKFIPDYATLASLLTKLLQKKQRWL